MHSIINPGLGRTILTKAKTLVPEAFWEAERWAIARVAWIRRWIACLVYSIDVEATIELSRDWCRLRTASVIDCLPRIDWWWH